MTSENKSPTLGASPRSPWRWMVLALVAVVLVYPVVRRLVWKTGAPVSPALRTAIESSFSAYRDGRYEEAIAYGNAALQIDPNSADAYNNIGASYAALRNWDPAIQNIRQALRIKPDYELARNNLAWYLSEKAGDSPAPSLAAGAMDSYVNASLKLYQAGKYRECIGVAHEALKLYPNSAQAYNNIAAASSAMGRWDDAIAAAQQAVRIDPGFALAKNNLAWALEQKSKKK